MQAALCGSTLGWQAVSPSAQAGARLPPSTQVKPFCVYKLLSRFVEWPPPQGVRAPNEPFVIAFLGADS